MRSIDTTLPPLFPPFDPPINSLTGVAELLSPKDYVPERYIEDSPGVIKAPKEWIDDQKAAIAALSGILMGGSVSSEAREKAIADVGVRHHLTDRELRMCSMFAIHDLNRP